jgi:HIRAN domain
VAKKPKMEHYTIVGLQYRTTKEARRHLATKVPFSVIFKREKKNEYDPNAIAVFVAQGNFLAGQHIGYLRKEVAAVISPKVDAKEIHLPAFGIVDAMNVDHGTAEVRMALSKGK